MKILKNKRFIFVALIIWLLISFFKIRYEVLKSADIYYKLISNSCFSMDNKIDSDICLDELSNDYADMISITQGQIIDTFILFLVPIIILYIIYRIILWISKYKY